MKELVSRAGLALGERLRLVVVAEMAGRLGVGLRPPAGSAEMPRAACREETIETQPERASNAAKS